MTRRIIKEQPIAGTVVNTDSSTVTIKNTADQSELKLPLNSPRLSKDAQGNLVLNKETPPGSSTPPPASSTSTTTSTGTTGTTTSATSANTSNTSNTTQQQQPIKSGAKVTIASENIIARITNLAGIKK